MNLYIGKKTIIGKKRARVRIGAPFSISYIYIYIMSIYLKFPILNIYLEHFTR